MVTLGKPRVQVETMSTDSRIYLMGRLPADTDGGRHCPQAAMGFSHGAQRQETGGPLTGIVERFHRRFQVPDRQFPVAAQFGDLARVV